MTRDDNNKQWRVLNVSNGQWRKYNKVWDPDPNDFQNDSRRRAPPPPPPEMDDLAKRRGASDELQKIIADVDAIKFRVDDILDVHKNDPSLISDDLRKTTLKNAREAAHLLEKSLLRADAVESYGFTDIRAMRKGLVARVENLCGKLEPLTKE